MEVAAALTGAEQENFKKVSPSSRSAPAPGDLSRARPGSDHQLPRLEDRGRRPAGRGDAPPARRHQAGRREGLGLAHAGRGGHQGADGELLAGLADIGKVADKRTASHYKAANKSLIWHNAQVFENAGAAEPKTWDELLTTAQTIYDSGVTPFSVGGADGWTTDWFENVYLSQAGPEKYDQLAAHRSSGRPVRQGGADHPRRDLGKKDYVAGGASGALQTEFPASVTQTFTGGDQPKAGMVYEGDFVQVNIAETDAEVGTDAKVYSVPGRR